MVMSQVAGISVEFAGWLHQDASRCAWPRPMCGHAQPWPEPFGLVGPEANRHGVPVVAFATGGIPNGCTMASTGASRPVIPRPPGWLTR